MGTNERNVTLVRTELKAKLESFFLVKMKMISGIYCLVAVFTMASATKKGDGTLLSVLSKERVEMKNMFHHENKELRQENTKLQQKDDQLRKRDEQLIEQLKERIVRLKDEKLQNEDALTRLFRHAAAKYLSGKKSKSVFDSLTFSRET